VRNIEEEKEKSSNGRNQRPKAMLCQDSWCSQRMQDSFAACTAAVLLV